MIAVVEGALSAAEAVDVRVRALGDFAVVGGPCAHALPHGRSSEVIRVLAALGGAAPVDVVVEHLWADSPPGVGRTRLRNVLSRLRGAGCDIVDRSASDALVINAELDVRSFLRSANRALALEDLAAAREAVALYGGELLPTDPYAAWAVEPREHLRSVQIALLDLLARSAEQRRDLESAMRWIDAAIAVQPWDETHHLRAAAALLAGERVARAARYLRRARMLLEDLGVRQHAELERLERIAGRS